jgi:hypothetical protein
MAITVKVFTRLGIYAIYVVDGKRHLNISCLILWNLEVRPAFLLFLVFMNHDNKFLAVGTKANIIHS